MQLDLPLEIQRALDRLIAVKSPAITRHAAVRAILNDWLRSHGYMEHEPDGLRPDQLSAENDG